MTLHAYLVVTIIYSKKQPRSQAKHRAKGLYELRLI